MSAERVRQEIGKSVLESAICLLDCGPMEAGLRNHRCVRANASVTTAPCPQREFLEQHGAAMSGCAINKMASSPFLRDCSNVDLDQRPKLQTLPECLDSQNARFQYETA